MLLGSFWVAATGALILGGVGADVFVGFAPALAVMAVVAAATLSLWPTMARLQYRIDGTPAGWPRWQRKYGTSPLWWAGRVRHSHRTAHR